MIETVIFDLDGVLVDTAKYHYTAWRKLAQDLGGDLSLEENEKLKGVSRMDSLAFILRKIDREFSEQEKVQMASNKNDHYLELIADMKPSDLLPGSIEFLKDLKENNLKIALGSASKNAIQVLEATEIKSFFDAIVDGNGVTKGKPDPEVFENGAKLTNTAYENCLVIEDALKGLLAAKKANMKTIGISNEEKMENADYVFKDLSLLTAAKLEFLFN